MSSGFVATVRIHSTVTEWCGRGTLEELINDRGFHLNIQTIVRFAVEIAQGMNYLHSQNPPIIHRDLKTQNILVDNDLHLKVTVHNPYNNLMHQAPYSSLCSGRAKAGLTACVSRCSHWI